MLGYLVFIIKEVQRDRIDILLFFKALFYKLLPISVTYTHSHILLLQ